MSDPTTPPAFDTLEAAEAYAATDPYCKAHVRAHGCLARDERGWPVVLYPEGKAFQPRSTHPDHQAATPTTVAGH